MSWLARFLPQLFSRPAGTSDNGRRAAGETTGHLRHAERQLGYSFGNPDLLHQALLHRSFHQQAQDTSLSNERLEFLGDAVLNLVVAEYLYTHFPGAHEGDLTKIRSRLVNKRALTAYAESIDLGRSVRMSHSAAQSVGKGIQTILADTFEAVIAAIYLDGGYAPARTFIERQVIGALESGSVATSDDNYKSMLLEYVQAKGMGTPRYTISREEGPDHDRTFVVDVIVNNERLGTGVGKNKKEAEQAAASEALRSLG
jgi:ribonuclease III